MCLASAYMLSENQQKHIGEVISCFEISGSQITLVDFLGQKTVVSGSVQSVDLVKGVIQITCEETGL